MKIFQMRSDAGDFLAGEYHFGLINLTRAFELKSFCVRDALPRIETMPALFAATENARELLLELGSFIESHSLMSLLGVPSDARIQAPIRRPPKIVGLALSYKAPQPPPDPFPKKGPVIFMKPSSSVIGPNDKILLPTDIGAVNFEAELAIVIGRAGSGIKKSDAMEHIFGYTALNDVTAVDILKQDIRASSSWVRAKAYDTFTPMGPCVVTTGSIDPPVHLDVNCRVNGEVRQAGNTQDLILNVAEIVELVSAIMTLEPGDVIATGSPPGAGPIEPGDMIECEIPEIGSLVNHAICEEGYSRGDLHVRGS